MTRWTTDARAKLLDALDVNPNLTRDEALQITGVSRQRLHQLSKEIGRYIPPDPRPRLPALPLYDGMSPYVAACVSEMAVSFDLLRRGYDVYRSLTYCGGCDLVAIDRATQRIVRVEAKTARRTKTGKLIHSPTGKNKFDVLALVLRGEDIVYQPPL